MKKQFNLMAVAASALLALTACTTDKLEASADQVNNPTSADNAVQFGTYMGKSRVTRAITAADYSKGAIGNTEDTGNGVKSLAQALSVAKTPLHRSQQAQIAVSRCPHPSDNGVKSLGPNPRMGQEPFIPKILNSHPGPYFPHVSHASPKPTV